MSEIRSAGGLVATASRHGHGEGEIAAFREELERGPLSSLLAGARYRWLSFRRHDEGDPAAPPTRFTATLYDYSNVRAVKLSGRLDDPGGAEVALSSDQPVPTEEEFREAVAIVERTGGLGAALRAGKIQAYQPMPPLIPADLSDGGGRRVLAVGLYAGGDGGDPSVLGGVLHHVIGVDLSSGEVDAEAGTLDVEANSQCGAPLPDDECEPGGRTGQSEIAVYDRDEELWRLVVVRPAESSGRNGSGVELRHVRYRGRSVLRRAHMPILNVEYQGPTPACGPTFRDWLNQEACFDVPDGDDVADGIRVVRKAPSTILESGVDGGNFRGVAVYFDGDDLLLTSEMRAGWYRYITDWRLSPDGTIRPRAGFSAVQNFCTCQAHIHHSYWRLDWAIDGPEANFVEEFNREVLSSETPGGWTRLLFEVSRSRDEPAGRHWRVGSAVTGDHYSVTPGPLDGQADLYGAGDTWWLRAHDNEIDDGQGFTNDRVRSRARIDLFANGEPIDAQDVVSWYAGHWPHVGEEPDSLGEYLGPTFTCSWGDPASRRPHL